MPRLLVAEQVAGAADLEVAHRDAEARAELGVVRERREAGGGVGRQRLGRGVEHVGVGALAAASDPAADLVRLRQAELVGALDDQRVRGGDVEPRLDDRRRHQAVVLAADEGEHRRLQLQLVHLAVRLGEPDAGAERAQALGGLVQRLDAVVEEEGLAAALDLAPDRPRHQVVVVGADEGPHRPPALGRGLDHRDVAQPGQRHLQRPRDRGRRHRQHVDLQLQLAQQLLLLDAEALLLVHDQQAQVLGADVAREQAVGADQDVDLALAEALQRLLHLGRLAQPRDHLDVEGRVGEALAEAAEVLLGEDRRRHQHHHLLAVDGGLVGGPQRDLGLAVADVAADQAVHRPLALHVGLDRVDRLELVGGLAVGERGLEGELQLAVGRERVAAADLPLGVEVEQLAGHLLGGAARPRLQVEPALAARARSAAPRSRRRRRSG